MEPQKINFQTSLSRGLSAKKARIFLLVFLFFIALTGILLSNSLMGNPPAFALNDLLFLESAPTQPLGYYDYFGNLLSPKAVGPFAGLSAVNNAVHSSEINLYFS